MEQTERKATGPLDESDKHRLILKLVMQLRCAVCGEPYNPHDWTLVNQQQNEWVLGIRCRRCTTMSCVVILLRPEPKPEPIHDLTPEEIQIANEWPPISRDDVLDLHEFLEGYQGDLATLFS